MTNLIPKSLLDQLKQDYVEILDYLKEKRYKLQELPEMRNAIVDHGEAYAIAYPIQGILKYHGLSDFYNRLAFFPSISLNNAC